jgi:hypothetical protein
MAALAFKGTLLYKPMARQYSRVMHTKPVFCKIFFTGSKVRIFGVLIVGLKKLNNAKMIKALQTAPLSIN